MKKKIIITSSVLACLGVIALAILYICTHDITVLNPKGLIGLKERKLIVVTSILMLIVLIPVYVLTIWFASKYRADNTKAEYKPNWGHSALAESIWWGIPLIIITILAGMTWSSSHKLNPFKPLVSDQKPITIQVVALQWKWLFIYPEQGIATLNYLKFPTDVPLNFEITADAPMNSFWIPQLGGQIYAMPAMRSKLHLIANEKGTYRGSSANLSGKGFAGMIFNAEATSQEEFNHWVNTSRQSSSRLELEEYNLLVAPSENNPVATYNLGQPKLFEIILEKYMAPQK